MISAYSSGLPVRSDRCTSRTEAGKRRSASCCGTFRPGAGSRARPGPCPLDIPQRDVDGADSGEHDGAAASEDKAVKSGLTVTKNGDNMVNSDSNHINYSAKGSPVR